MGQGAMALAAASGGGVAGIRGYTGPIFKFYRFTRAVPKIAINTPDHTLLTSLLSLLMLSHLLFASHRSW